MNEAQQKKAVIYARVSSAQQTTRTDGLSSQEQRCRLYCEHKGYEVVEIFKDDMSGSVAKRPGMDAMLSYLRKTRKHSHVVVIDDVRRQNIWHRSRRKLAECGPRLLLGFRRRAYGVASADVQWSVA